MNLGEHPVALQLRPNHPLTSFLAFKTLCAVRRESVFDGSELG